MRIFSLALFVAASGCGGELLGDARNDASVDVTDLAHSSDAANDPVGPDVGPETGDDASPTCTISASNYDQSCSVDSDCINYTKNFAVAFGDWCSLQCECPTDAINRSAAAQYDEDVLEDAAEVPHGTICCL